MKIGDIVKLLRNGLEVDEGQEGKVIHIISPERIVVRFDVNGTNKDLVCPVDAIRIIENIGFKVER